MLLSEDQKAAMRLKGYKRYSGEATLPAGSILARQTTLHERLTTLATKVADSHEQGYGTGAEPSMPRDFLRPGRTELGAGWLVSGLESGEAPCEFQ